MSHAHEQVRAGQKRKRTTREDYTIAIIVPLAVELTAVVASLDSTHDQIPTSRCFNSYTLGEIGQHNVAIASLPSTGTNESSSAAVQLLNDFPNIRFGLLVGIGAGVPDLEGNFDIRLGDVVVCEAIGATPAVIQFDRGKKTAGNTFEWTGHLNGPPPILSSSVKILRARCTPDSSSTSHAMTELMGGQCSSLEMVAKPHTATDLLFASKYDHQGGKDCTACDQSWLIQRTYRQTGRPHVHYGPIGSSNALIKSGTEREKVRQSFSILCIEMEAAGLMNILPCLVIRGICDYADSHKNKHWQPYAATTAAFYMKELLLTVPAVQSFVLGNDLSKSDFISGIEAGNFDPKSEIILQALVDSLSFHRMDARLHNIEDAYPQTCDWLFDDERFQSWINRCGIKDNHGIFWIKGKPGSGKSTAIKTILVWLEDHHSDEDTISYFFNARATTDLEKSTLGLYRSLVHKLVSRFAETKNIFFRSFKSKYHADVKPTDSMLEGKQAEAVDKWTEGELRNFLCRAIRLLHGHSLNIVIDALDESDETDVRRLVDCLQRIALDAVQSNMMLRICLSSRHYPQIRVSRALSLILETHPGHERDIESYVRQKLDDELENETPGLRAAVCEKSQMVFLWVSVVVPMLTRAYDRGKITEMLLYLKSLPRDLEDLFETVLSRQNEDIDKCDMLLRFVLFAKRPMSPIELYLAVQPWKDRSLVTEDDAPSESALQRFLTDVSRGLVEITTSHYPTVQFTHDSIRTFLLQRGNRWIAGRHPSSFTAFCHNQLKGICYDYVRSHVLDTNGLGQDEYYPVGYENDIKFKFLAYALENTFAHAEQSRTGGISQDDFLRETNSSQCSCCLIYLLNSASYFSRPSDITQANTLFYSLLYLGHHLLMQDLLRIDVGPSISTEGFYDALGLAVTAADFPMFQVLMQGASKFEISSQNYDDLLLDAGPPHYAEVVQMLIEKGANVNVKDTNDTPLLQHVILEHRLHSRAMIEVLVSHGADVNAQSGKYCTALQAAACHDQVFVEMLLLQHGADPNIQGGEYGTALLASLAMGDPDLLAGPSFLRGADPIIRGGIFGFPLQAAAYRGATDVVQLLLDAGAEVNARGGEYDNALYAAVYSKEKEAVQLLVEHGADVNAQGGEFATALQLAASQGLEEIVEVLLIQGADCNIKGGAFGTALSAAVHNRHFRIARMLQQRDAIPWSPLGYISSTDGSSDGNAP